MNPTRKPKPLQRFVLAPVWTARSQRCLPRAAWPREVAACAHVTSVFTGSEFTPELKGDLGDVPGVLCF